MKTMPCRSDVQLVYVCPACEVEHYAMVEETQFPGGVLCYCGKKIKFETIYDTEVIFKTKEKKTKEVEYEEEPDSQILEDVISALCSVGYKNPEAKKKALEATRVYDNVEDCLNYCFTN